MRPAAQPRAGQKTRRPLIGVRVSFVGVVLRGVHQFHIEYKNGTQWKIAISQEVWNVTTHVSVKWKCRWCDLSLNGN